MQKIISKWEVLIDQINWWSLVKNEINKLLKNRNGLPRVWTHDLRITNKTTYQLSHALGLSHICNQWNKYKTKIWIIFKTKTRATIHLLHRVFFWKKKLPTAFPWLNKLTHGSIQTSSKLNHFWQTKDASCSVFQCEFSGISH